MKLFRKIILMVVLVLLVLVSTGCDVVSTLLMLTPQGTSKPATLPASTSKPNATAIPTKPVSQATQAPPSVRFTTPAVPTAVVASTDQFSAWGDICQAAGTQATPSKGERFSLNSAVVLVLEEKATRWINIPSQLSLIATTNPDDVRYLVCIKESSEHAFNYTGGAVEGRRRIWNVTLVNAASKDVFYTTRLVGANPPSFTTVVKGTTMVMGADPVEQLLVNLLNLYTNLPPLTAREESDIVSLAFSPDGKTLLVTTVKSTSLFMGERSLNDFSREEFLTYPTSWKPQNSIAGAVYTADGAGVVVRDFQNLSGNLHYLTIQSSSANPRLKLVGSAPCFGWNCEAGPVLPGNIIRRGDCEWKLDAQMACTPRFNLPGSVIGSSENGEWVALGAQFAPTSTPTAVLSSTPTRTRTPSPRPGTIQITPTREPSATRTETPTRAPTLTRSPTPIPEHISLWNRESGLLNWNIPVQSPPSASTRPLNPPVVVFSPDGAYVAVKYYDRFEIWEIAQAKNIGSLYSYNNIIAFSPTSAILAAVNNRKGVDLFDLKTLQYKQTLEPKIGAVDLLAFSPDGKRLAVASGQMVRVVDMP